MDNRKRQRLEVTPSTSSATIATSMPLGTIAGQSFFLSTNPNDNSSNNVLLTICDDQQSDESQEFLSIDESLAHIKQEDVGVGLPLQYRIVNPMRHGPSSNGGAQSTHSASALLPATVQLPSGCDIYLVKEYVESAPNCQSASGAPAIKLETSEKLSNSGGSMQLVRSNVPCLMPKPSSSHTTPTPAAGSAACVAETNNKRSYILETYKKRDDKRRATHNEVERRRRDKINSWIFKLKEMIPEMQNTTSNAACNTSNSQAAVASNPSATATSGTPERSIAAGTCRTPPSDSKSQILIKACEYIKTMQEEIKSLRECLTENESLRLSNQRLQLELDKLKNERQGLNPNSISTAGNSSHSNHNNNNSKSYNITLNTLNGNGLFGTTTPSSVATYTKRELIIRDYVD